MFFKLPSTLAEHPRLARLWRMSPHIALFGISLGVLLLTMPATIYNLDSAEFATGAHGLGIVHAPGYPLYILIAHLFTYLPVGDVGTRVNLLSVFSLAATVPVLFTLLYDLTRSRRASAASSLIFVWSYYVWANGLVAEVYAPQLLMLTVCGWLLNQMWRTDGDQRNRWALFTGFWFGLSVAINPSSIFFAPGLVLVFVVLGIPLFTNALAGLLSMGTFAIWLLYFPIRADANPALNLAGRYDPNGVFQMVDLHSLDGIWWMLSGQQFNHLFFDEGLLPSFEQMSRFAVDFTGNFLGVGVVLGIVGVIELFTHRRTLAWIWAMFIAPYTYFFMTYGASDRNMMFGPVYLLWVIVIAYGLQASIPHLRQAHAWVLLLGLPGLLLVVNFPLLNLSEDTTRQQAEAILEDLPPDAVVIGRWWDIVPVEYLQKVEQERTDLTLYNLFLFERNSLAFFVLTQTSCERPPVFFLDDYVFDYLNTSLYQIECQESEHSEAQLCRIQRRECLSSVVSEN